MIFTHLHPPPPGERSVTLTRPLFPWGLACPFCLPVPQSRSRVFMLLVCAHVCCVCRPFCFRCPETVCPCSRDLSAAAPPTPGSLLFLFLFLFFLLGTFAFPREMFQSMAIKHVDMNPNPSIRSAMGDASVSALCDQCRP